MLQDNALLVTMPVSEFQELLKDIIRRELKENINNSNTLPSQDELMTIEDVQQFLGGTSKPTIYAYKKKYSIPVYRLGRRIFFKKVELLACMEISKIRKQKNQI